MGVRIFFCLSGFLITYLILKEINKNGKLNLKNFYIRRVLRIWPVYYIVVIFVFIIYASIKSLIGNSSPIWESPLLSALFLSNYDLIRILSTPGQYANGMLSLTWSVSVEEQFYLVWPLLFFAFSKSWYKYIIVFVILTSIFFTAYHHENLLLIYHHTVSNFIFLGTGGLLAYAMINKASFLRKLNFSKTVCRSLVFAGLLLLIYLKDILYPVPYGIVFYWIYTAAFLFFLLYTQVHAIVKPFDLSKANWLVLMGKYTYGLYMYHRIGMFIWETVLLKMLRLNEGLVVQAVFIVLSFITAFVLSYFSYQFIEKRLLLLKDRFSYFSKKPSQLQMNVLNIENENAV